MASVYGIVPDDLLGVLTAKELAQTTDDVAGAVRDDAKIVDAIEKAEGEINAKAGVYHELPLGPEDADAMPLIRSVIIEMAAWHLLTRRARVLAEGPLAEFWRERRRERLAWMEGLAKSKRTTRLPGVVERSGSTPLSGGAHVSSDDSVFGGDALENY